MTAWDVGAHIGFLTVIASRAVGRDGQVHAFEPHDDNRARLLETLRLNDLDNVSVHDVALSSQSGLVPFYRHRFTTSWSLDADRGQGHEADVRCTTLDDLAESIGTPDLIKIDAEGVELEVLRGGASVIAETRPVLIVEFSTPQLVDDARSLLSDYSFELLADRHWVLRPRNGAREPSTDRPSGS
jgi:FkbM family methyltransferase